MLHFVPQKSKSINLRNKKKEYKKEGTPLKGLRKRKCKREQEKQEEREIKWTEFDCQALKGLTESRDDSFDRLLNKHKAAGSL